MIPDSTEPPAEAEAPKAKSALSSAPVRLFLISFLLLFFELTVIRWIAANVFYVGYFTNFVLLACLLGIGLGCLGGRWKPNLFRWFPMAAAAFVCLVCLFRVEVTVNISEALYFQAAPTQPVRISMWALLPVIFFSVAALFTCLAQPLGGLFRALPPLPAYTWNICGSLAGIAGYTAMAFACAPSVVWFLVSLGLFLVLGLERGRFRLWQAVGAVACLGLTSVETVGETYWSPYYKIRLEPVEHNGLLVRTNVYVNGVFHQLMIRPELTGEMYHVHYEAFRETGRFDEALIIGAGTGTDVAVGLLYGVRHIDAVEIDPVIVELGRQMHPFRPYDSPQVEVFVDDGRAFLQGTDRTYDLVVFGLPDSLTLLSGYSSLRLENYLFTKECFQTVKSRLKENGVFVLYNFYREPWYIQKLARTLEEVFGEEPLVEVLEHWGHLPAVLMAGPRTRALPRRDWPAPYPPDTSLKVATDDWPFNYLRRPTVPLQYLAMFAVLVPLSVAAVLLARPKEAGNARILGHFFFMGAGFFLLEAKSVVQFSLLFGSTWLVNSLVFFAILLTVLLANLIVARFRLMRTWPMGLGLVLSLLLNYLLPLERLLVEDWLWRYIVASAVIYSPIFFANLLFSRFFRDTEAADLGFASNLLGTLAGGVMEYASMVVGYRHLALFVGLFYALVFMTAPRRQAATGQ